MSLWLVSADGRKKNLVRWIEEPEIIVNAGIIQFRLNEKLKPYLLESERNFTQYPPIYSQFFHSKYSIRLYELVCSLHCREMQACRKAYRLGELKQLLGCDACYDYRGFRRRVMDRAVEEVSAYSDKNVSYSTITQGRKVIGIELVISSKDNLAAVKIRSDIEHEFGPE